MKKGLTMMSNTSANVFRKVTHCIFDMDGLLLDTEKLYTQAAQTVLDKYNKTYTWEVKLSIMGLQTQPMAEKIVAIYDLPITWEEYAKQQRDATLQLMMNATLMPDTEGIYEQISRQIAQVYGKLFTYEVRLKLMGTVKDDHAKIAVRELQLPISTEEYLVTHGKLSREMLTNPSLMPGAERLLRHLHASKIPICLATSSGQDMVDLKLTNHQQLFSLFNHKVCGSSDPEVKHGKPAPDIFCIAASRFPDKPHPCQCLVFEDSPNGVTAARTAGMQCVMVPDEHVPPENRKEATQVLGSLQDFKPEEFCLPPFNH